MAQRPERDGSLSEEDDFSCLRQSALRRPRRRLARVRRGVGARVLRGAIIFKSVLLVVASLAAGIIYWRLAQAPLRLDGLSEQVTAALAERIGDDWRISIDDSAVTLVGGALGLEVEGLALRDSAGRLVARAPTALVAVSTGSIVAGAPAPRGVELRDTELRLRLARDGTISITPQEQAEPAAPAAAPPVDPAAASAPLPDPIPFAPPASAAAALGGFLGAVIESGGPVGAIEYAALTNARVTLVDESGRERAGFERVDASFETAGAGRRFQAEFSGEAGTWRVSGEARAGEDGGHIAWITVEEAPLGDILLFSGLSPLAEVRDLKLRLDAEVSLSAEGAVEAFTADLAGTPGALRLDDPNMPVVTIGDFSANLAWDSTRDRIDVSNVLYAAGDTDVRLAGFITPDGAGESWRLELEGAGASLSGAAAGDAPVRLDRLHLLAHGGPDGLSIEDLSLKGPRLDMSAAFSFGARGDEGGLRVGLEARDTDVREALRVWPEIVAPTVRGYLVETLASGTLERLSLATVVTAENFRAMRRGEGLPPQAVEIGFSIVDAGFAPNPGLPPLTQARIAGVVRGRSAEIAGASAILPLAGGRVLALSDGGFAMEDFWRPGERAAIGFRIGGGADALAALLRSPIIARAERVELAPEDVSGAVDIGVSLAMALNAPPDPAQIPITVEGTIADLSLRSIFGDEDLTAGAFTVSYRDGDLDVRGAGRLSEDQADVTLTQKRGAGGEATIALTLDKAARERRGVDLGDAVSGPLPLKIKTKLSGDEGMRVEADLAPARIDNLIPGWVKPAGQPGAATMLLRTGERPRIEDFVLEAGAVRVEGDLDVDPEGGLAAAELTSLRLSPGDDARASIAFEGGVWRATVRAGVVDARPFIALLSGAGDASGEAEGAMARLDLDLRAEILTGHNGESITNAELALSIRPGAIRDLSLRGRFPGAAVAARKTLTTDGVDAIVVESDDAGAALRFVDVYGRMGGGELLFEMASDGEAQPGRLVIRDFVLRDEPALRSLVAQQPQRGGAAIDAAAARFTQARADFVRRGGRIDLTEAVMWGVEIGFRLDGYVDRAQEAVDIRGTFVPAFGLNNAFAQVPLFGAILGGGRHEGLIGVNFRVAGPLSAPTLTVNPLSAIAPGFLRRLFEAGGAPAYDPARAPPAAPTR